jgi:N-acetylmuramoyl-L-alanine amidase
MRGFEIYFMSERASDPWAARVAEMENEVMKLEDPPPPESAAAAVLHDMARVEFMNESSALSGMMAKELKRRITAKNHGVKQAAFFVLRGTQSPSVLVEIGYLSNPEERANLTSEAFRKKLIDGIYASVLEYAKLKKWQY